jgi:hypothetical protein
MLPGHISHFLRLIEKINWLLHNNNNNNRREIMNKLKFRNFFGIATLLGGVALITPITLSTTSCSTKE